MSHRLCLFLFVAGITLTACETTPLHPRAKGPNNPGVSTEIGKPLASVNQVVPIALERCGFLIDKRQFVDGIVNLEAGTSSGIRVHIQLSSLAPDRTHVEIRPEGDAPEGVMLQMVNLMRDLVWK